MTRRTNALLAQQLQRQSQDEHGRRLLRHAASRPFGGAASEHSTRVLYVVNLQKRAPVSRDQACMPQLCRGQRPFRFSPLCLCSPSDMVPSRQPSSGISVRSGGQRWALSQALTLAACSADLDSQRPTPARRPQTPEIGMAWLKSEHLSAPACLLAPKRLGPRATAAGPAACRPRLAIKTRSSCVRNVSPGFLRCKLRRSQLSLLLSLSSRAPYALSR